ncbi:Sensor histidine kinase GraS [bioreactor metagenome]|uniref:histidine kinase n=1 Tax=bioreactor metagenome TaxID=1076179 RepID=A0A645AQ07_9ZZZZ
MYLKRYLWRHKKIILLMAASAGMFAAVFSLYELPVEAVGYAAVLCLAVGAVLFLVGYARYIRRHRQLTELSARITLSLDGLPQPRGLLEEDYQALLALLFQEKTRVASRADSARSDMADYYTLWAHQIKTPIAAMRLLLQQEGEDRPGEELALELFKIEQYVEMVLQYLRLDSEATDYVLAEYELDDLVRQAVRKYARLFVAGRIALEFNQTGLRVVTDEKWLVFVLEQLLSNALKYTPQGSISIYAEGERLVVADSGIGIRPEDLPRVFEKGFTGYNGRVDKKSTGIGLYLCKRILTKLGHTISIHSEVGAGTRVTLGLEQRK